MTKETRPHYDIDQDISVEMIKEGNWCYVSVYNDSRNTAVAFSTTANKLKGLADFLNKNLENK